jgi:Ulp1 family protease
VLTYLEDQAAIQKVPFVKLEWNISTRTYTPQQNNCHDCGVYVMMYADLLLDNIPLDMKIKDVLVLSPNNMPFFRRKICADIRRGQLNYNNE